MSAMSAPARTDAKLGAEMLRWMRFTRRIEERIERKLYRQGKIVGGVYVGRGQEAVSVGAALRMRENDLVAPSHRDMAVFLIRGISAKRILAQYMGRMTGVTRGRDGNMHMGDMNHGIIAFVSHLADTVPVAAGAALAFKMTGTDQVAFCFFGEGATSRGDWHEGVNFAAVQKLPVVYVCNNNQWAYSTPQRLQFAVEKVSDRAIAYDIPGVTVDGNDVFAVYEAVGEAADRARRGEGPSIVEGLTFRMTGHSAHDDAGYVPPEQLEEWRKKDPIDRLLGRLKTANLISDAQLAAMDAEIEREIDEAVEWAEAQPYPAPEDCLEGVYHAPAPRADGTKGV